MKIYVATWVEYGGYGVIGVYRTREAAEKACSLHDDPDMCSVEEHELDAFRPVANKYDIWFPEEL